MEKFYIYKITNLVNGKIYIGKTKNIRTRWNLHLLTAKKGPSNKKRFQYIHRAIRKYGKENFKIEIIDEFNNENECLKAEKYYIKKFKSRNRKIGYNLTDGGDGASGYKFSKKQKEQMSKKRKGKYIGDKNPFYGKTHSKETKEKLSELAKTKTGKKNPFYGKTHSKETKKKIRETKEKTGNWGKKKYLSNEQIEEIRIKYSTGNCSWMDLAKEYSISKRVIGKIINYIHPYLK